MNLPAEFKAQYWQLLEHLQQSHASRPFNIHDVMESLRIERSDLAARLILHQFYNRHFIAPVVDSPEWPKHIVYLTYEGREATPKTLAHA